MPACLAPLPPGWSRRRPETSALYEAIRRHALSFALRLEEGAAPGLPRYVRREIDGFLKCGILAHGFVRVHCRSCRDDFLVAFSCKGRGICPSCAARRMTETAARWVDRLFPEVAFRQWVLALPWELRPRLSWDGGLLTEVLSVLHQAIASRLRLLLRRRGIAGGESGAAAVVQRFGSALNLEKRSKYPASATS